MHGDDQRARRVVVERHDQVDAAERGEHRHAIVERIERAVVALAEAAHRRVGVDRDGQRGAQRARLLEVGDVAAVQEVEHAVGEHPRARQRGETRERVVGARDLRGELAAGARRHRLALAGAAVPRRQPVTRTAARRARRRVVVAAISLARVRLGRDDDAHQVDDAALGDDLDMRRRELVRLDEARLHLRGDVGVVGARREWRSSGATTSLVVHGAHAVGALRAARRRRPTIVASGTSPDRSTMPL